MKYFLLVCEGLADDPSEELGGRTPLEVAKTPFMDELAQKGRVGVGAFMPASLPAQPEVALFSMLGYDALEYYTGIAPLEALAMGLSLSDGDVAFRCDFVTVADGKMMDATAGRISDSEASSLLKELRAKLENASHKLTHEAGYKNILICGDAAKAEDLDDMECTPPQAVLGQKISAYLPKGKAQRELLDFMNASKTVLESHEVNRVRIDLKENPASQCWLWGQGRKPKMPSFKERSRLDSGFYSETGFVKGLAKAVGLEPYRDFAAMGSRAFSLFYKSAPEAEAKSKELKIRIKHIEDFDANVVGPLLKKLASSKDPWRLAVATERRRQNAPLVMAGAGIQADEATSFSEKNCAQSGLLFDPGHSWLADFLKK